jgi:hypothetical protein
VNKWSLAARTGHVAANWWQSATFRGFAARRLARKIVSMKALAGCNASNHSYRKEIRTPVQSLATHSSATHSAGDASFDMKSETAEST